MKNILKDQLVFLSTMISSIIMLNSILIMGAIGITWYIIGNCLLTLLPIWVYPEQQINIFTGKKLFKKSQQDEEKYTENS